MIGSVDGTSHTRMTVQSTLTVLVVIAGLGAILARGGAHGDRSSAELKVIRQAASSLARARSVAINLHETMKTADGRSLSMEAKARIDQVTHNGVVTITGLGRGVRNRDVDHVLYARVPETTKPANDGKPWVAYAVPPSEFATELAKSSGTTYLSLLAGANGSVDRIGVETVGGVTTTHYRVTVDAVQLINEVVSQFPLSTSEMDAAGLRHLPVDVWLDSQGLPRQIRLTLDVAGNSVTVFGDVTPSGAPLHIATPAAGSVNTVTSPLEFGELEDGQAPRPSS
jgi:hypothetical protein